VAFWLAIKEGKFEARSILILYLFSSTTY